MITDGGLFLFSYSQTLAMNDVTVNDNNENGYVMKNIAGSRNQRTDNRGSAYGLMRETPMGYASRCSKSKLRYTCTSTVTNGQTKLLLLLKSFP